MVHRNCGNILKFTQKYEKIGRYFVVLSSFPNGITPNDGNDPPNDQKRS
jgi:hypothetical protein